MMIVNAADELGEMTLDLTQRQRCHSQKYDQEYDPVKAATASVGSPFLRDPAEKSLTTMIKTSSAA